MATVIGLPVVLEGSQEPGAAEVCALLRELLSERLPADRPLEFDRLKREVFRLRLGDGPNGASLVLKRLRPATAQTDRLVAQRWLPALGLARSCPRLFGAAAQREGDWVWHVYEDIGEASLAADRHPQRLAAAVDLIARLHTRAAVHPLLSEIRWLSRDLGSHFLTASLRDALAGLTCVAATEADPGVPPGFAAAHDRLRRRLRALLDDAPRRVRLLHDFGGPDTLLHGDLWPKNVFVDPMGEGPRPVARLIDWDHVGVGSFSYDLSTLLYRSAPDERHWMAGRYREAVERAGWYLPGERALNLLFHTAEVARCAHCIVFDAMAIMRGGGTAWAFEELMDFERWLEALRPPLPD